MESLNFNEGYKEFCINNDETRIIRFNPSDVGIIERFAEVERNISEYKKVLDDIEINTDGTVSTETDDYHKAVEKLADASKFIKEQLDYAMGAEVSNAVFEKQSPFSLVGGKALFERFIECIKPVVTDSIKTEREASEKRINKYQRVYKK